MMSLKRHLRVGLMSLLSLGLVATCIIGISHQTSPSMRQASSGVVQCGGGCTNHDSPIADRVTTVDIEEQDIEPTPPAWVVENQAIGLLFLYSSLTLAALATTRYKPKPILTSHLRY